MSEEERTPLTGNNASAQSGEEPSKEADPTIIDDMVFQDIPVFLQCPHCGERVVSKTEFESGRWTYWTTACLCLFQCYCCCWIPFLLDGLKDVIHTCPKCDANLGKYKRINAWKDWRRKRQREQ